jgi:hypothetical protein
MYLKPLKYRLKTKNGTTKEMRVNTGGTLKSRSFTHPMGDNTTIMSKVEFPGVPHRNRVGRYGGVLQCTWYMQNMKRCKHCNFVVLLSTSPRFLRRPTAFCSTCWSRGTSERSPIKKTADLPLQLWVGTFPRFVAIRFYFLSETLI